MVGGNQRMVGDITVNVAAAGEAEISAKRHTLILSLILSVALGSSGCVSPGVILDPEIHWQQAERELASAMDSMEDIRRLQNEYETVVFLDRSGELRGLAFLRLAEIDRAQNDNGSAREHLKQALRAGLKPSDQSRALLMLGGLLERDQQHETEAQSVYRQLMHEYPVSEEAELAKLRMEVLKR